MANSEWRMADDVACELARAPEPKPVIIRGREQAPKGHFTRTLRFVLVFIFPFLGASLQAAPLRVIEETAIPFAAFLSKADFDQRYPGERIDDPSKLETGWYVIYEHESLNYYFGPMLLESTGEDYLAQLTETVEAAVAQRPSIQDYRLELSYEPSASSSSSDAGEPPSDPSIPNPLPPQPEPKPSFWSFVKKIFGFG